MGFSSCVFSILREPLRPGVSRHRPIFDCVPKIKRLKSVGDFLGKTEQPAVYRRYLALRGQGDI